MDKNAIKKFAVWARTELLTRVSLKGVEYGITEECEQWTENSEQMKAESVNGKVLTDDEKKQRTACIIRIKDKGYKQVMEEIAYTWFNRFSALRFMEVNGYLPSHVRVFTDEENNFKPQIITEAIHLDLDGLDMEKVFALKEAENIEELYKYLLKVQCNALNKILPGMFQRLSDYTELLLPGNLLREGSVIQQMIELIPEDDWKDAVQIIGWLYQYYNSEKKDDVFAALKKNVKITKENIPAATQLFTPDWIVRYMVENSLGRLWLEGHPDVKEQLLPTKEEQSAYMKGNHDSEDPKWHYYLEEAEQEPEVQAQLAEIRKEYTALTPDQLKVIDPCSGSGHILAYMFDVLMKIYESYGYTTREAVASIVENNLYGLDIDDRAAQLAYFAVMMKARQYDRRFFSRKDENGNLKVLQPHVYAIVESGHTDKNGKNYKNYDEYALDYFCNGDIKLKNAMDTIIKELHDAKEYGSILTITPQNWSVLYDRFAEIENDIHLYREEALDELLPLVQVAEALAQKYDVVVTNPPYMGASGMSVKLSDFVKRNYPDSKSDLFAVFIECGNKMVVHNGINCMVTMQSWMFLTSFEKMRVNILQNRNIINLMHLDNMVMGIAFGTVVTVFRNCRIQNYKGTYNHVKYEDIVDNVPKEFPIVENRFVQVSTDNFVKIPGSPVAYWVSDAFLQAFDKKKISDYALARNGMKTGDNGRFVRLWWEPQENKTCLYAQNAHEAVQSGRKWFPYNKGGEYRKWYGNNEYVVDWKDEGNVVIGRAKQEKRNVQDYPQELKFKPLVTWSLITSSQPSFRYKESCICDIAGMSFWSKKQNEDLYFLLALCNTKVAYEVLRMIAPTVNFQAGDISRIPAIFSEKSKVVFLCESNIQISHTDWDSFETSWDFQHHPLLRKVPTIAEAFDQWQVECSDRFNQLKANEEEMNRIFIDIYGLQDELTPEVKDKDVTVRKADLSRDIRSFISYAVGCMFGRYSLDVEGLAYAGGEWDNSKYASFVADKDNIIPICDDEYFEDDIVGLFVEFVKTVYGADTLDENLKFIADALGGKGQPKDVIRNYFLSEFYSDHCKIYQKRPIYWLFDSGKKNGFKALIYMHRYQPDTIARIRTDYVHEQQARYRTSIADLEQRIANTSTGERVKLNKKLTTLQAQDTEIRTYEEKIHHLADQMISIDLDDGVKKNYAIFQDVLAKIK